MDKSLTFAMEHTDKTGRVVIDGEIDCKDSGWLVLAGVIRQSIESENCVIPSGLRQAIAQWTSASVNVDDRRSAWTTFCLLYATYLSGGRRGSFYTSLSLETGTAFDRFIMQIDMKFLREASKNYFVAAGLINYLRQSLGYLQPEQLDRDPDEDVKVMLDAYLGDGFFNDDDIRGSSTDRRIDGYSGEIIGLLLHYDEIHGWNSRWHDRIINILRDYVKVHLYFIDSNGEYAKWGRSLRGEAELKKIFLWEYAEAKKLVCHRGDGIAAALAMREFSEKTGIAPNGRIGKDKAFNKGVWDEYTTNIQAQGYGVYGLAMAAKFAKSTAAAGKLPAAINSYLRCWPDSGFIAGNDVSTGIHYIVPLKNRLTKLMYLWHNRITGENDVSVDMSAKFMPLPYFGYLLPAPYSTQKYPFLPVLRLNKEFLYPKNVMPDAPRVKQNSDSCIVEYEFGYCGNMDFNIRSGLRLKAVVEYKCSGIDFLFTLPEVPDKHEFKIFIYTGHGNIQHQDGELIIISNNNSLLNIVFSCRPQLKVEAAAPSIYGAVQSVTATLPEAVKQSVRCSISWKV